MTAALGVRRTALPLALALMALGTTVTSPSPVWAASEFAALSSPARLLDSRPGAATVDGQFSGIGSRPADSTLELQVTGRAGVPADAVGVVLNVTVDSALGDGFLTVFPCGTTRPNASSLQYVKARTIANLVVSGVGVGGKVCLYNLAPTDLVVDITGSFPAGFFAPLPSPERLLDSRAGALTADGQFSGIGVRPAATIVELPVAGRVGLPADASAVALNLTVDVAVDNGFVTAYPCGTDRPNASSLNYTAGQTISNAAVVRVGVGGKVCLYNFGATHMVVDATGSFPAATFNPLSAPQRLLDSRPQAVTADGQFSGTGVRPPSATLSLPVAGRGGVPADASSVVVNVTVAAALDHGFVTVHPTGTDRPNASNLNYSPGQTIANAIVARLGVGGSICLHTYGAAHLVVDVVGWFAGPPPPSAGTGCPAQQLFPHVRMVALYGNDIASALGALGEQSPEAAAARLAEVAAPWRLGDRPVLGSFELIATIANSAPGADGLYQEVSDASRVQRYLDVARAHGLYLVLDIQPGRSDFLTEVRRYESFLRQPDIGVALDPEWRVGPGQVPGQVVGQVSAAEVNQVSDYLAGIVAEEALPTKLLVIHQFQTRMLTERQDLRAPAELAVVIHMDGFGTRAQKLATYAAVHADPPLYNGFKLFYDEDIGMFSPAEVLGLSPVPDLVTYQ